MKTITNEKTLEQLLETGVASYKELVEANCIQKRYDNGLNDWGLREYVIIDTEGNQWDYQPEEHFYVLREHTESVYLEEL